MVRKWESSYRECETHTGRQNSEIEEDTKIIWSTYWSPLVHAGKEKKEGGKYPQRHFQDLFVVRVRTSNYREHCEKNTISVLCWQLALFLIWLFYRQQVPDWSPRISGHSADFRQLRWGEKKCHKPSISTRMCEQSLRTWSMIHYNHLSVSNNSFCYSYRVTK